MVTALMNAKEVESIRREVDVLLERHADSLGPERVRALAAYRASLNPDELERYKEMALSRLREEGSAESVELCKGVDLPEALPLLTRMLDAQTRASHLSHVLVDTLRAYPGDRPPEAIAALTEREHMESVKGLASDDFDRASVYLKTALKRPEMRDVCLHILHERAKAVGLEGLIADIKRLTDQTPKQTKPYIKRLFEEGTAGFSPFTGPEIDAILNAVA